MGEYKTVTLFVVGSNDRTEQESIKEENSHHSDVILGNFTDNGLYETMALIVGHVWVKRRCAEAQNVMKADDKTFINLEIMLPLVSKYLTHGVVMGYCKEKMAVSHMGNILNSKEESSPSCYAAGHVTTGLTASSITDMMKWVPVLPSRERYLRIILSKLASKNTAWDLSESFLSPTTESVNELCFRLVSEKIFVMHPVPMEICTTYHGIVAR